MSNKKINKKKFNWDKFRKYFLYTWLYIESMILAFILGILFTVMQLKNITTNILNQPITISNTENPNNSKKNGIENIDINSLLQGLLKGLNE